MKTDLRHKFKLACLAFIFTLVHFNLYYSWVGLKFEPMVMDAWFAIRGQIEPPKDVVLVAIDEESYEMLNISHLEPWPRAVLAKVLEALAAFKVKVVALDVAYQSKPDFNAADRALADAMVLSPTVLGAATLQKKVMTPEGERVSLELIQPDQSFVSKTRAVGSAAMLTENGIVRRFAFAQPHLDNIKFTFAEAVANIVSPQLPKPSRHDFIKFYGPSGSITTIPIWRLLSSSAPIPEAALRDKVVVIGYFLSAGAAAAAKDTLTTPFYQYETFGPEIQATAIANLLSSDWIKGLSLQQEKVLLTLIIFLSVFAMFLIRPGHAAMLYGFMAVGWALSSYFSFLAGWYIPGAIGVFAILPLALLFHITIYYFQTYRKESAIRAVFSRYVAPEVVKRIAGNPSSVKLGGEKLETTILFSDIAGFTPWSEHQDPEFVTATLNRYFTVVADIILKHNGTLMTFMGDGLFALWGAPVPVHNPNELAIKAAIEMQKKTAELAASGAMPPLATRIGIGRGSVLVGNLGSENRLSYTAIGDTVNLTSRLEAANKKFGTSILISEEALCNTARKDEMVFLGRVLMKGKQNAIAVYTMIGDEGLEGLKSSWSRALEFFKQKKWNEAAMELQTTKGSTLEIAATLYADHIHCFRETPPPSNCNGEIDISS